MSDITCLNCKAVNPQDAFVCCNCEASLVVGKLTSMGRGVLPKGFVWELRARALSVGRNIANDFVIPSNLISGEQLQLDFVSDGFTVTDLERRGRCMIDGVEIIDKTAITDGQTLRIGLEEFVYNYLEPADEAMSATADPMSSHLQLMLGIISEFHTSLNLQEVFNNAVDAVLRITRTKRGYAFLIEQTADGDVELREVAARTTGGTPTNESNDSDYTISQSIIQQVLAGHDSIIIEDAAAQQVDTETIRKFRLKSIVCLPLVTYSPKTGKKQAMGIIYADSLMPTGALPKHCRPTLQMLTQIVTSTVVKWQNYNKMETLFTNYERSLTSLEKDLELVSGQITELQGNGRIDTLSPQEVVGELDTINSRIKTVQTNLNRLHYMRKGV